MTFEEILDRAIAVLQRRERLTYDLYRAMEMTFWLPRAEVALAQVEGQ
jgi:hypothetical protein